MAEPCLVKREQIGFTSFSSVKPALSHVRHFYDSGGNIHRAVSKDFHWVEPLRRGSGFTDPVWYKTPKPIGITRNRGPQRRLEAICQGTEGRRAGA
jgi:hypothetical protein